MPESDLFANFDRMRREMDELFGDAFERSGLARRRRAGFSPPVDVAYTSDPPRAIVTVELAGVDIEGLDLEIQGRKLILAGERGPAEEFDLYQQVEIERGRFRRVVELAADVLAERARASYDDGILRVELPLAHREVYPRAVSVETGEQR
ncbi:MAG: Hsp20/alpha crystallin family protein [Solirubrobacterales bacterium]|nr:Hsp20/alpha crystallin family protein [Solirubrobacterales bacterium]MBV9423683.1 Hsp20/alpha crystallin family protein [Solirubrobacterales bacterium]MBV9800963.1 Hsp20/alpha crystallin family protein [Solirubrobacterales bacterium]